MDVTVNGKIFTEYISANELNTIVSTLAKNVEKELDGKDPLFLIMLNGAFVFASDFLRALSKPYETVFVRYTSYMGMETSGKVSSSHIPDKVKGRNVVILEDIVDSGLTMDVFEKDLILKQPASITLVSLLSKPTARKVEVDIDFEGKEIEDKFVVGYGLDYDGFGRNLPSIYRLKE